MKKVTLVFGSIAGAVLTAMMAVTMPLYESGALDFDNGELLGYTTMVIALSMVFFGVKSYRDNQEKGFISFGKAFQVGILITLVASFIYVISWEILLHTIAQRFPEIFTQCQLDKLKEAGASTEELAAKKEELHTFMELYKNPFIRIGMTFMEVFPVGLIVTLICAAVLKKKGPHENHQN